MNSGATERGMTAPDAIRYPNLVEAFALYNDVMGVTDDAGDRANRLDVLASTLARPVNLAMYEDADLARQTASLLWGMIHNHPFADGNKRAGLHIAFTFARVNGLAIIAPEDAVVETRLCDCRRALGRADGRCVAAPL